MCQTWRRFLRYNNVSTLSFAETLALETFPLTRDLMDPSPFKGGQAWWKLQGGIIGVDESTDFLGVLIISPGVRHILGEQSVEKAGGILHSDNSY